MDKMDMKNKRVNNAVSEVVGTAILLGIAIALFSVVQVIALSYPYNPSTPSARLVGTVEQNTILIEHHGGESLSLDTKIVYNIEGAPEIVQIAGDILDANTSDGDDLWSIGEKVPYTPAFNISGLQIRITVIDVESNSIVMKGIILPRSS